MFLTELQPLFQEFAQHPISFMGGLVSGVLRLNLNDDPVKTWLNQQGSYNTNISTTTEVQNGKSSGPQSIDIE
ncbi:hypothetical protein [Calothrix rhizosoleniae]|uniref:hypothetical protein n=1 Tax=Calothrix rhizosoleniae TaxID=888997 RepID=UPI000B497F35|nr:hypothetical protein [Calothrix rhizosoleniae]